MESIHYESSKAIAAPLFAITMNQGDVLPDKTLVTKTKSKIFRQNKSVLLQKSKSINKTLTEQDRRVIAKVREKDVYSSLSVLPLEAFGFDLNKG